MPQYKDRLGKKEEAKSDDSKKEETKKEEAKQEEAQKTQGDKKSTASNSTASAPTTSAGFWNDLASSALKSPLGKLTGAIANNSEINKFMGGNAVGNAINSLAQKAIGSIANELEKNIPGDVIKNLIPQSDNVKSNNVKSNSPSKEQKTSDAKKEAQDPQAKYPEYNRIDYKNDSKLVQRKKRVAQIKQDISELDAQLADIKKERKETGHSTLRHNELVKASRNRSKLMKELTKLSS